MITPDHKRLISDVHKANDRLMMLMDTMSVIKGVDKCKLDMAESYLMNCMEAIEEAIPGATKLKVVR